MQKQGRLPPGVPDVTVGHRPRNKMQVRMKLPLPQVKESLQRMEEPPPPKYEITVRLQNNEKTECIDLFAQKEEDCWEWTSSSGSQRNMGNDWEDITD
jgi:hypothetical protein